MAINFPNSPVNNETYTENGVKWKYNSTYNAWFLVDDNKLLANTSNNQLVYIYNDKLVSSNGLVYSESSNTIYTNSVYVKSINVESGIAAAFDKANSANVLVFNTGIGANAFTSATISGANTAVGAGANAFTSATISGANTAVGTGANAFTSATVSGANTAVGTGANAFTSATVSGANTVAIAAFGKANSALANSTGTFSGNLTLTGSVNARSGIISTANNTVGSLGQALLSSGSGTYWGTISASSSFPAGTVMLFVQTAAPTGWTKSTTHNDKALRVVSGTASSGGSVAFSTAFASQSVSGTVGSTTLATTQIPSHTHGGVPVFSAVQISGGSDYERYISGSTGATGGGQSHNHTFTGTAINLAVNYVDVIIATKD